MEHKIHLKQNAISKHQKPYRLPPYKREILREQLDSLLEQEIIVPVNETVVLVTKRNDTPDSKTSSQSYRFCCDFRHLNAQTEDFNYTIPNLQDLSPKLHRIL